MPIHYKALAEGLSRRGHKITVIYADRFGGPAGTVNKNLQLKTVKFRFPKILHYPIISKVFKSIGLTEKIRFHSDSNQIASIVHRLHKKEQFDIIESPNNGACLHKLRSLKLKNCIRIATTDKEHSIINETKMSPYLSELFKAEEKTFHNCPNLITHTKAHRDNICYQYNLSPKKFTIIPLSVKIPDIKELNFQAKQDSITVLFVGRFETRKGIDIVLRIIPEVLHKQPTTHFRLVGPDPGSIYESKFRKDHPNLKNHIAFLGEKRGADLNSEYKNCDIFLAPSRYESFGLIYAEAMSFAKPVIGTNIGGIPEVIEDGKTGLLCENENDQDFIEKLLLLIKNKGCREQMGKVARIRAIELFDFENLVSRTESYYQQISRNSKN